jgi:death-on-curing protein
VKELLWIDERDARAIHDRLLALHGGAAGLRDSALLESALAWPRQVYTYSESPDLIEMAASYTAGIVCNHPFVDGNKRTGFVVGVLSLEVNSHVFTASEEDAAQAILGLAAGAIDEGKFLEWLRAHVKKHGRR